MEVMASVQSSATPFDNLGPAARVAYSVAAPADEVEDAGQQLMKAFAGYSLPNQLEINQLVGQTMRLKAAEASGDRLLAKALAIMHPEAARQKACTEPWISKIGGGGKWIPKPGIPAPVLRTLSKRIEVAQAIHRVWVRKAQLFAQPSTKPDEPGFQLYHLDPNAELDERQNDFLQWLTRFIMNGGREFSAKRRKMLRRQTFPYYMQKVVSDSLTFDFVCTETVPLIDGVPGLDSFYCRDGATFFLANFGEELTDDEVFAYQVVQASTDQIPFRANELAIWQRNMDSDLNSAGYGVSELEASVDTLSNWITAMQYTREGLDNNAIPRGILSVFGQFDRNTREMFKAAWDQKVRGVANAHNLPVLFGQQGQTGDVKFTPTGAPFNEMAFAKWISLQASIMGAIYGTDPKEIGMDGFSSGNTSTLSGNDTQERLTHSENVNFDPFMNSLAAHLRDEIISTFGDWIGLRFTGLIDDDAMERQKEKRRMMTINEIRHELGMDPHPLGWFGALPADSGLQQAEFQRLQQTLTYDEARAAWGGAKVAFPSELVGLAPINPSMGALYNMAAQAAGADAGGEGGEEADHNENPFEAMNPANGGGPNEGQDDGENPDESQEDQGENEDTEDTEDTEEDNGEGKDEDEPEAQGLKADVAAKLKQV